MDMKERKKKSFQSQIILFKTCKDGYQRKKKQSLICGKKKSMITYLDVLAILKMSQIILFKLGQSNLILE